MESIAGALSEREQVNLMPPLGLYLAIATTTITTNKNTTTNNNIFYIMSSYIIISNSKSYKTLTNLSFNINVNIERVKTKIMMSTSQRQSKRKREREKWHKRRGRCGKECVSERAGVKMRLSGMEGRNEMSAKKGQPKAHIYKPMFT